MTKVNLRLAIAGALSVAGLLHAHVYDRAGRPLPEAEINSGKVAWRLLDYGSERDRAYNGIGDLHVVGLRGRTTPHCTATFIATNGAGGAPAYAITNAHCTRVDFKPARVAVDQPPTKIGPFVLNYYANAPRRESIPVRRIVYAAEHGTDLAILELGRTYEDLVQVGFRPVAIDPRLPAEGEPVTNVGVPKGDLPRDGWFLRASECRVEGLTDLREGEHRYRNAVRHRCSAHMGSSGSPLISQRSGAIVALHSSTVDRAKADAVGCSEPCEVDAAGSTRVNYEVNYAQSVHRVPGCFDGQGRFALSLPTCGLERP